MKEKDKTNKKLKNSNLKKRISYQNKPQMKKTIIKEKG